MRGANARGVKLTVITGGNTGKSARRYTERNRVQQRGRNARRGVRVIANEDVSTRDLSFTSGTYRLIPAGAEAIANGDAWTVEIAVLSKA